ncbi:hypothetical protein FRB94_010189 [Tulasnella sp. JGI-2019a]|nr:hypothetical protein FRB94_010189 [Tulasnella sp. JGI-2019a]
MRNFSSIVALTLVATTFAAPVLHTQKSTPTALERRAPMQNSNEDEDVRTIIAGWDRETRDKALIQYFQELNQELERAIAEGKCFNEEMGAVIAGCEALEKALTKWQDDFGGETMSEAALKRLGELYNE